MAPRECLARRGERLADAGDMLVAEPGVAIGERAEAVERQHEGLQQRRERPVVIEAGLARGGPELARRYLRLRQADEERQHRIVRYGDVQSLPIRFTQTRTRGSVFMSGV